MRICLVTPAPVGSTSGNRVTAERWSRLLTELGHETSVEEAWDGSDCDLLIALHARKSADSVQRYRASHPGAALIVGGTGTDVYEDAVSETIGALSQATRIVVLQPTAIDALPESVRPNARAIFQSAPSSGPPPATDPDVFQVCQLGHLREVKDPFLLADATRLLPVASRVRAVQAGAPLDAGSGEQAERESADNPRYSWRGELSAADAHELLRRSRLMVLTSRAEGGANVVSEALAAGVPVLSSRIDGTVGLLGADYPGLFPVGDAAALATLLGKAETDRAFLMELALWCADKAELVRPERERAAWKELLDEMFVAGHG
jgi:putative glycosyltransferase (TIGR04348 family)